MRALYNPLKDIYIYICYPPPPPPKDLGIFMIWRCQVEDLRGPGGNVKLKICMGPDRCR